MKHWFTVWVCLLAVAAFAHAPNPASLSHWPSNGANTFTIVAENAGSLGRVTNVTVRHLPTPITVSYDLNGNLTWDGLRSFSYDAENQLTNVSVANRWKTEFVYDGLGRKRIEREYVWSGGGWQQTNETRFAYDGFLVIQERNADNQPRVTYTRGLDLSGTLQGAGGIGGLLARSDHLAFSLQPSYFHSDGSGNVTALMDGQQHIVARYLYDPFGRQLGQWGELAEANRYRFSSKELHPQSGLYYYGFRHYDPAFQRWLTEDPIGEAGGMNLYGFVENSPLNWVDDWGMQSTPVRPAPRTIRGVSPNPLINREIEREMRERGLTRRQVEQAHEQLLRQVGRNTRELNERFESLAPPGHRPQREELWPVRPKGGNPEQVACTPRPARGFSNTEFGQEVHEQFRDALVKQTATRPSDWRMRTRPGQTGVDADYIGPASRNPGFDHAELKPFSPGSIGTFGNQLGNWTLPPGRTQRWFYNAGGTTGSSGFNF